MGGSDVRCRNDHSLVAEPLEETVPVMVHRDAVVADDDCSMYRDSRDLSIHVRRNATVYIFPVLDRPAG